MTCIIGLVEKDKVYIGGDSAGVAGYNMQIRSDVKVFRNGPFIMGFTSSFRMGQLLHYVFEPPIHPVVNPDTPEASPIDDMRYMVSHFIPAVRECFKTGGFQKSKDAQDHGGTFLVGYKKKLYEIDGDYQVGQLADNVAAVGCGGEVALGAMYALNGLGNLLSPADRIKKALDITVHLNSGVRPPFIIEEL
jgi:ATP-dependent protease HslVU (ClpYQ) peptidase subunit